VERTPSFLKWLASSLAGIALFTGLFLLKGNGRALPVLPQASPTASSSPTQVEPARDLHTLLVTVTRDDQHIASSLLIVATSNVSKVRLFVIEPRIVIDTGASSLTNLATAGFETSSSNVQRALTNALGVRIDGSLVLQRLALAGLIDSVRGVDIENPSSIRVPIQQRRDLVIPPGKVHLDGSRAAAYALVRIPHESMVVRTARLDMVLRAAVLKLPNDFERMKQTLSALGSLSRTTVPTGDVANFLLKVKRERVWKAAKSINFVTVPSRLVPHHSAGWQRFDLERVVQQVSTFTKTVFVAANPSSVRVAVVSHYPSDRLLVRKDFRDTSYVFVDGGESALPKVTHVRILGTVSAQVLDNLVATLGLKHVDVTRSDLAKVRKSSLHPIADLTVTLGVDYRALHIKGKA